MILYINWDYATGKEKSNIEIKDIMVSTLEFKELETHCLHFFNFEYLYKYFEDIIVRSKVNGYISLKELLDNKGKGYCTKQIRKEHNVEKLLISNMINFKKGEI